MPVKVLSSPLDVPEPCSVSGCGGKAHFQGFCLGHMDGPSFDFVMERLFASSEPLDGTGALISGDRVTRALKALESPGSGRITQPADFSGAVVDGDVTLTNTRLDATVLFAGARVAGGFFADTVIGIGHLTLGGPAGPRTTFEHLHVADCVDEQEELIIEQVDVADMVRIRNIELRSLRLDRCRLGEVFSLGDVRLDTLDIHGCAWEAGRGEHLRLSGGATVAASKFRTLSLRTSTVEGWTDFAVVGSLEAHRCRFGGPVQVTLDHAGADFELAKHGAMPAVDVGGLVFGGDARELNVASVRFESTAELRWGQGRVLLPATIFGQASTLDQDPAAELAPELGDVAHMDGDKLLIKAVDLSSCLLSGATTLGAVQPERLSGGRGVVGVTYRRHVADEAEYPRRGAWKPWKWPGDARRRSAQNLAELYRDLRKKCEDSGNYAGANDLYYGERLWQRKASRIATPGWVWLAGYGLVGYGVRPWRPLALLVALVLAATLAFDVAGGLEHRRVVAGHKTEAQAALCKRNAPVRTPAARQDVRCAADLSERLEFSVRTSTTLVRQATGFNTTGLATAIDIALRVLAAVLFGLLVLAVRNRVRR